MGIVPSIKMACICTEVLSYQMGVIGGCLVWMEDHGVMKREDATSSALVTVGDGWRALSARPESGAERSRVGRAWARGDGEQRR